MAQLKQPSASAKANSPTPSAPESDAAQPARISVLPLIGLMAAIALGVGAYVYYQGDHEAGTGATAPQATTSDNTASTTTTTPLNTEAPSSMQTTTMPKTSADESRAPAIANAAASARGNAARPHRVAKSSKPAKALEPRDRQVVLATPPHPVYPLQALRAGEQGTVLVLAQVNVDGQVTDARVVRHSGSSILDRAAPSEVRHWKFEPALHDGRPVVASIEVPVSYRLNQ
jgi:protein TonB